MGKPTRRTGFFLVITGALFWGVGGTVAQKLFQQYGIHVNSLVTTRLLIAGFLLLILQFLRNDRSQVFAIWKNKRTAAQLIIFGLLGRLAVQYTYMASNHHWNAAVAY